MGPERKYVRSPTALWRRTIDRLILLPADHQECLILGGTALPMWDCFTEPCSLQEAATKLAAAFEVEENMVAADIAPLGERLIAAGALMETAP